MICRRGGSSEPTRTKRLGALEAPKVCRIKSAAVRLDSADTQGGMEPGVPPARRPNTVANPTHWANGETDPLLHR